MHAISTKTSIEMEKNEKMMEGIFSSCQKDAGVLVDDVINYTIIENNTNTADFLANIYVEHGFLERAQSLFDRMPSWELISWNSLIAQYAKS